VVVHNGRFVASLDRKCLGPKMPGQSGSPDGRDIFDKETRRKPLAFAADAVSYGISIAFSLIAGPLTCAFAPDDP
jgi:hypothetical protein